MRRFLSYAAVAAVVGGVGVPVLNASALIAVQPAVPTQTVITFEDLSGSGPLPLDQYAAQGMHFAGTPYYYQWEQWPWTPHSGSTRVYPEHSSGTLSVTFDVAKSFVGAWLAGPPASASLACTDADNKAVGSTTWITLSPTPTYLSLVGSGIRKCAFTGPPGQWILDDVTFDSPEAITFGALADATFGDGPRTLTATASSGLPVSYTVPAGSPCSVAASTLTITGAGSCVVTASQAGDGSHVPATSVVRTLTIGKATQTIPAPTPGTLHYLDAPVALPATTTAGLPVTYTATGPCTLSSTTLTLTGAGSCSVVANALGNTNYLTATTLTSILTINPATTSLTISPITISGLLQQATVSPAGARLSATLQPAIAGLPVTFSSGGTLACTGRTDSTGVATCTLTRIQVTLLAAPNKVFTAAFAGTSNYAPTTNAATITRFPVVTKMTST
jgi:hypothetical protein